ncbi:Arginine metabolism regulation protein II [Colletotrichum spinosum]|uniref:Arginine metabolism regulation protein II n=1 Tax=Colletotrichum spinosum TaxID=1347390 RepID=A0A4R8PWE2_9PEZI|nr:Arginine metabolism regulation protein II [Colletotrichum spinosum]
MPVAQDIQINRGPFGVFRFPTQVRRSNQHSSPESASSHRDDDVALDPDLASQDQLGDGGDRHSITQDGSIVPVSEAQLPGKEQEPAALSITHVYGRLPSPLSDWYNTSEWWNMDELPDSESWWGESVSVNHIRDTPELQCQSSPPIQRPPNSITIPQDFEACPVAVSMDMQLQKQVIPADSSIPPKIDCNVPHDAVHLLKHYSSTVLRGLTPYRHSKTPWHILFIPYVKSCLAALTLGEEMDHASLTAFFGTLAVSASSLGCMSNSRKWTQQAETYKQQARHHVRLMLKTAYDVPKVSKYKSILMAILTMVQISSVSGTRDQTECYLLEAEKFIRVKGLNRRKSRKVRLLHHCYTFERLLHESTYPTITQSAHRLHVRRAIESSNASAYSLDSLSFRLTSCVDLDQQMQKFKDQQEGENDLHLQIPGIWLATLYPEIFGIPEIHLLLLSLVIRLERAKEDSEYAGAAGLKEFLGCAKAVEKGIHRLKRMSANVVVDASATTDKDCQGLLENLAQAMQLAVAIYFYRTIYNVEPDMLQDKVRGVRDCLLRFEATESETGYGSARLLWPATIAAKEAEDLKVRRTFRRWFTDWGRRSGLRSFPDALEDVERAWEEKRGTDAVEATETSILPDQAV